MEKTGSMRKRFDNEVSDEAFEMPVIERGRKPITEVELEHVIPLRKHKKISSAAKRTSKER